MDEFTNGTPQYAVKMPVPTNGNPQINDTALTSPWQPHAHNHQHGQENNHNGHGYDFSALNLQKPALPHRPAISLSHEQVDHMKREAAHHIANERRQLDEAEQVLAMPGFVKAFELFLRATQRK